MNSIISKQMNSKTAKTVAGKVTEAERDEIKLPFERKNGLYELFRSLNDPKHPLCERIVQDMGDTATKFQKWWMRKASNTNGRASKADTWESISPRAR